MLTKDRSQKRGTGDMEVWRLCTQKNL